MHDYTSKLTLQSSSGHITSSVTVQTRQAIDGDGCNIVDCVQMQLAGDLAAIPVLVNPDEIPSTDTSPIIANASAVINDDTYEVTVEFDVTAALNDKHRTLLRTLVQSFVAAASAYAGSELAKHQIETHAKQAATNVRDRFISEYPGLATLMDSLFKQPTNVDDTSTSSSTGDQGFKVTDLGDLAMSGLSSIFTRNAGRSDLGDAFARIGSFGQHGTQENSNH